MDSGAVSLEKPTGWGDFQDDDAKQANYVEVRVVGGRGKLEQPVNVTPDIVVARLETFAPNAKLRFTYGNAEVQSDIGHAEFRFNRMAVVIAVLPSSGVQNGPLPSKRKHLSRSARSTGTIRSRVSFALR